MKFLERFWLLACLTLAALLTVIPAAAQTPTPISVDVSAQGVATALSGLGLSWVIVAFIFFALVLYVVRKFVRR